MLFLERIVNKLKSAKDRLDFSISFEHNRLKEQGGGFSLIQPQDVLNAADENWEEFCRTVDEKGLQEMIEIWQKAIQ